MSASRKSARGTAKAPARAAHSRQLRIIGGKWRGRRLRFPPLGPIRPTPDRVRETLFNWIGSSVPGARCLDLFAGSGALGLEALSRGSAHVTFVECDPGAVRALRSHLAEWDAVGAQVQQTDALRFLARAPAQAAIAAFQIAFLDPPFGSTILAPAAQLLEARGWLAAGALIYVESDAGRELPPLPERWRLLRAKRAGAVGYHLLERAAQARTGE
ncbi:MAG TPA: 16S rRNA (guanine(966)-N(2))-methyltransferase RsmD [Steroidobacteraceae bacterium]